MSKKIKFISSLAFIGFSIFFNTSSSFAVSLEEALKSALLSNEQFKILQESFLQNSEQLSRAVANSFMPKTNISASIGKNQSDPRGIIYPNQTFSNSIQTTVPLFLGGAGLAQIKASHNEVMAAKYQYYKSEQDTILNLINLYIDYHVANEVLKIRKASTTNASQNYQAVKEKVNLGEATKTDLAFAEANFLQAQTEELSSLATKENKYQEFATNFSVEPEETKLPIINSEEFEDTAFLMNKGKKQNLDLKIYSHNLQSAGANVAATVASNFSPKVSATGSLGTRSNVEDMDFTNFGGKNNVSWSLNINIPILSNGGQEFSDVRAAKSKHRAQSFNLANAEKILKTNIQNFLSNYTTLQLSINSTKTVVDAQKLYVSGVEQEYKLGNKSLLDLLQADSDLAKYQINYVQTLANSIKSFYALKSLVGELTAKKLRLGIKVFDPEKIYNRKKLGFISF